jgi:hypothetical protein
MAGRASSLAVLAGAAVLVATAPLAADWLVLKDGSGRVETKGAWEVRGNQVVFHLPNDSLGSLRASELDLEASKKATEEAAAASKPSAVTPPAKPAEKKAVLTLTDNDVGHVDPEPAAPPAPATPAATGPVGRISVNEWHQDLGASTGGVTLVGEITNSSADIVGDIHLSAKLVDDKGKLLATGEGLLGGSSLRPGARTVFRVTFPGVYTFSGAQFETKGLALKTSGKTGT